MRLRRGRGGPAGRPGHRGGPVGRAVAEVRPRRPPPRVARHAPVGPLGPQSRIVKAPETPSAEALCRVPTVRPRPAPHMPEVVATSHRTAVLLPRPPLPEALNPDIRAVSRNVALTPEIYLNQGSPNKVNKRWHLCQNAICLQTRRKVFFSARRWFGIDSHAHIATVCVTTSPVGEAGAKTFRKNPPHGGTIGRVPSSKSEPFPSSRSEPSCQRK